MKKRGSIIKKEEAKIISQTNSKVVIEYISQILSDNIKVEGKMNLNSAKINNQNVCTLDIYVPARKFEKHINLGVTIDHSDILNEQIINCLLDKFLTHETLGISQYTTINYMMGTTFSGIIAYNSLTESKVQINFQIKGINFNNIINNYNKEIKNYLEKQNQNHSPNNENKQITARRNK